MVYGSATGLQSPRNRVYHQNSAAIAGTAEEGDRFGESVTVADFDGDGFADLAVGVPFESVDAAEGAGAVNVIYGSEDGLQSDRNRIFTQNTAGIAATSEAGDAFGHAVAAGDFDGDGFMDLAVSAWGEAIGPIAAAGLVNVIYGSTTGLTATGDRAFSQDTPGVIGVPEAGDRFGTSLATGDFDGDTFTDLAIGVRGESLGAIAEAGAVNVLYGSVVGLDAIGDQAVHQAVPGIEGSAEPFDGFGSALATGDVNGDEFADLIVGVPFEDLGVITGAGVIHVIPGSAVGLTGVGDSLIHQSTPDISGLSESGDFFGLATATGDYNADGRADLAIGAAWEDLGPLVNAGSVNIIYGSATGPTSVGNRTFNQNSTGIAGIAETDDMLGTAIAVASPPPASGGD